jgi:CDP-diacylglycerol--glycerol-3-phosphate 3-phosphatidyltransferase/cardiolipin synthase
MNRGASPIHAIALPNLLTYVRIAAVPALVACLLLLEGAPRSILAFLLFSGACLTDWLDGYLARMWAMQSSLGRMLDPIADKLLVGAALMMLVYDHTLNGLSVVAALVILCREILVSGLREFLAELNVKVHVTWLSKWKTFVQMAAIAVLLLAPVGDKVLAGTTQIGIAMLWVAAALTIWTGYDYLRAGIRHAVAP